MTAGVRLPDGRLVSIAPEIRDRLICAVVALTDVTAGPGDAVHDEIDVLAARLRAEHAGREPSRIPGLAAARTLYKSFGMDPSRHRPSSEALLRRVLQGKGLYRISNLVDACNLASLEFLLPIGMYDLDRIEGDVVLRTGGPGEEYPGIRKGVVHLADRLGLFDAAGPFGSPTSDSARTCTTDATRSLLAVIMAPPSHGHATLEANARRFGEIFVQHAAAQVVGRWILNGSEE
jgi:DNA/RNA-binding domain of Phe-tRNA-synthetase-like protein